MKFNSNHNYDDWYVSGGCYSFAVSIMNVLKHLKQKYTPWMMGDGIHVVIKFNNTFWDIGNSAELSDKSDYYVNGDEDTKWRAISDHKLLMYAKYTLDADNDKELLEYTLKFLK